MPASPLPDRSSLARAHGSRLFALPRTVRLVVVAVAAGLYPLAFPWLFAHIGLSAGLSGFALAVLAGLCFGRRVGIATALVVALVNPLLYDRVGAHLGWSTMASGTVVMFVVAGLVGWLREMSLRLRRELAERRQTETALDESRKHAERLALVARHASTGIVITNPDSRIEWVNEGFTRLTGYALDEVCGRHPHEFMSGPDSNPATHEFIAERLARGEGFTAEILAYRKTGEPWWLRMEVQPLHDEAGALTGFMGIQTDISALKREEALQAGQKFLLELVAHGKPLDEILETLVYLVEEHAPGARAAVLLLAPEGRTLYPATAPGLPASFVERMDGLPVGPRVASSGAAAALKEPIIVTDVAHDSLWVNYRELALRHGIRAAWAVPIFSKDRAVLGTFSLYHGEPRTPSTADLRLLEVAAQIAGIAIQRHRNEQALRESREQYEQLVQQANDLLFRTDTRGRLVFANAICQRLTGYSEDEIAGMHLFDLVPPEYRDEVQAFYARQLRERIPNTYHEFPLRTRSGETLWVGQNVQLVRNGDKIVGLQGLARDITERRRAAEVLQASLEKERELNELKSRFVSMASHELRTPLATIRSSAELVARYRSRWDDEKTGRQLERIQTNVVAMTELLEDVLLFGRAEAGRLPFDPAPRELCAFVDGLVGEVRAGVGAGHRLQVDYEARPIEASVDERLLRNILENLLTNAIKYSDPGSPVRLGVCETEGGVAFRVSDQGIGIPESDRPHLFEPFHRASNVGTRRGTGLGLAIVKRAVDLHGGRIEVTSSPGAGTTFEVTLPRAYAAAASEAAVEAESV